ncbi:MAG: right-handed parallel beta-helix repeat-containing protein, partial [Ginsengibacter sp.]
SNIASDKKDSITILNSSFQYNSRQGLSWAGGNSLLVKNCKFNQTGRGSFSSAPSAGVDIEAEVGPIRNGIFINSEFINNVGLGLVANSGDIGDCSFTNCTFWGTTTWSIWVTKPGFTFTSCNIYGSFIHGYDSPDEKNATKFFACTFEDKPYLGKEPYGNYLIESNYKKGVSFTDCTFIANKKRLCWVMASTKKPEEKYQFINSKFIIKNANYPKKDFVTTMKGMRLKNCTFEFTHPDAKAKGYLLGGYSENNNDDLGGNKIIYGKEK